MDYFIRKDFIDFGRKINAFNQPENHYISEEEKQLKTFNLRFGLSKFIALLIKNANYPERSIENIENSITEYNIKHNKNITLEGLINKGFIRLIFKKTYIARSVLYLFDKYNKENTHSDNSKDELSFLNNYHEKHYSIKVKISQNEMEQLLRIDENNKQCLKYLEDKHYIKKDGNIYLWEKDDFATLDILDDEIIMHLWFLIELTTNEKIHFIIQQCLETRIYPNTSFDFLNENENLELANIVKELISLEYDLENSDIELRKSVLDYQFSYMADMGNEIPKRSIENADIQEIINGVNRIDYNGREFYLYQTHRRIYNSLLKAIGILNTENIEIILEFIELNLNKPYIIVVIIDHFKNNNMKAFMELFTYEYCLMDSALAAINTFKISDDFVFDKFATYDNSQKEEKKAIIRQQAFILFFSLCLREAKKNLTHNENINVKEIVEILLNSAEPAFSSNSHQHHIDKEKYLKTVNELRSSFSNSGFYKDDYFFDKHLFASRIINRISMDFNNHDKDPHGYINIKISILNLLLDLMKIQEELPIREKEDQTLLTKSAQCISNTIYKHLFWYFTATSIDTVDYYDHTIIKQKNVKRDANDFAIETVDWANAIIYIAQEKKLEQLYRHINEAITFNTNENKYHDQNEEQKQKLITLFKILCIAYLSLKKKGKYIKETEISITEILEGWIFSLSIKHNLNNIHKSRINIFEFPLPIFGKKINDYEKSPRTLLFEYINLLNEDKASSLIRDFFENSVDINMMIECVNKISHPSSKNILKNIIKQVDLDNFLNSVHFITEIENTTVNAVNSEESWEIAKPLLEKIKRHYISRKHDINNMENFADEIELLISYKEKNIESLNEFKKNKSIAIREKAIYYHALHLTYNEKDHEKSEKILNYLCEREKPLIEHKFQLLRVKLIQKTISRQEKIDTFNAWTSFVEKTEMYNKHDVDYLNQIQDYSNNLKLIILNNESKSHEFDQIINQLPPAYLYNEETFEIIFENLTSRKLSTNAYLFIKNGKVFYEQQGALVPLVIQELEDKYPDLKMRTELRNLLNALNSEKADIIPKILPAKITNEHYDLGMFILSELVRASRLLQEKIGGVKHEDQYNDLFIAMLSLRFELWGWSISDQNRAGRSPTGKNAGEIDLTIRSGSTVLTRIEALRLFGKNKKTTQEHATKTQSYDSNLNKYYMIIYYLGEQQKFDSTWDDYCTDFSESSFPENCIFNKAHNFKSLSDQFIDTRQIRIAKSTHGKNNDVFFFHIMIDLSSLKSPIN
ncbi:hypothetical protein [Candidatus Thiothrix anitrata]|uniref:Uncharacterized protein n=2 Tax=Candidatus Thiothrix anitrata TaxID=2823902 RepID=A0ABX7WZA4_9GAMM|nr:hypothetical protein [Candidatus Thiothrix anitrata]QTR48676.1 hypothetical protein J8380_10230 [Candidatus Thiothrix anitrata]